METVDLPDKLGAILAFEEAIPRILMGGKDTVPLCIVVILGQPFPENPVHALALLNRKHLKY